MEVGDQCHASSDLHHRKDPVPIYRWLGGPPKAGLDGCGKSRPHNGIRSPDNPSCSESLYRLGYLSPQLTGTGRKSINPHWGVSSVKNSCIFYRNFEVCIGITKYNLSFSLLYHRIKPGQLIIAYGDLQCLSQVAEI
jgi:hypothetical protein